MFNDFGEIIGEIINVNNVIQNKYDISKALTKTKEYFLKILTNIFVIIMFTPAIIYAY